MKGTRMKKTVGGRIVERLTEFTDALEKGEVISDCFTCRKVELDLEPEAYDPELVKKTRKLLGASQAIFAQFLGVSLGTVRAWEQGQNVPKDVACRFMDEIRRDPSHWIKRLKSAIVSKTVKRGQLTAAGG